MCAKRKKKALIANLPNGVGVSKSDSGRGRTFIRVRLGRRFTGGQAQKKDFPDVESARVWIFGEGATSHKAAPGSIVDLKTAAGSAAFTLSAAQLAEADAAFRACATARLSLTEAVKFAVRHSKPPAGVISVAEAIEQALKKKSKSKRPTYLADLKKRWTRFEKWLSPQKKKAINGIGKLDVRQFLDDCMLQPVGERNMLRNVSVLFGWAVDQEHMVENPCLGMAVEQSTTKKAAVRILSIAEVRKLFHLVVFGFKAEAADEEKEAWRKKFGAVSLTVPATDLLPMMAVGCFAGVRPEESARMTWGMVDFERKHIDLPAEITKDGDRRIVDMSDNLIEWLLACRKDSSGPLPVNFRRKRWALCRAMGWDAWPDDILRHSYGSYHLAKHKNAALTAEQMGHKNARMLYAHYREVVKNAADIEVYWSLTPPADSGKIINLTRRHESYCTAPAVPHGLR
ncbi:MAG: hypothetical protein ABI254_07840 [Chthoniobacterales bacterium]